MNKNFKLMDSPSKEGEYKDFMRYPEAAKYSGLSARSLRRLISRGKLKASKVGWLVVIDGKSLRQLMTKGAC